MHQIVDQVELLLGSLISGVKLQSLLKLVLGALVLACAAKNKTPNDPALRVVGHLLDAFPDLLDCLDNVALLELSKGPVHVRVMRGAIVLLGLTTNVERLLVDHVDVE